MSDTAGLWGCFADVIEKKGGAQTLNSIIAILSMSTSVVIHVLEFLDPHPNRTKEIFISLKKDVFYLC